MASNAQAKTLEVWSLKEIYIYIYFCHSFCTRVEGHTRTSAHVFHRLLFHDGLFFFCQGHCGWRFCHCLMNDTCFSFQNLRWLLYRRCIKRKAKVHTALVRQKQFNTSRNQKRQKKKTLSRFSKETTLLTPSCYCMYLSPWFCNIADNVTSPFLKCDTKIKEHFQYISKFDILPP